MVIDSGIRNIPNTMTGRLFVNKVLEGIIWIFDLLDLSSDRSVPVEDLL